MEENKKMMTQNKKRKLDFEPFQFTPMCDDATTSKRVNNQTDDQTDYLDHSIKIANKFLATDLVVEVLKILIRDDDEPDDHLMVKWNKCVREIKSTRVCFKKLAANMETGSAWTEEVGPKGKRTLELAVNDFFQFRLKKLRHLLSEKPAMSPKTRMSLRSMAKRQAEELEIQIITVFMAVAILHEAAHLAIRYSGKEKTPTKFKIYGRPEAGDYLENSVFSGVVKIFASHEKEDWSENDEYKGMGIVRFSKKDGETRSVFSHQWIRDVYDLKFTDKMYISPSYEEDSSSIRNTKPLKCCGDQENVEVENIPTPPSVRGAVDLEDKGVLRCLGVVRRKSDE